LSLEYLSIRSSEGFHHSEVGQLEADILVEEAIFKLQVTMGNPLGVNKSYGSAQLTEELTRIIRIKSTSQINIVECLSVGSQFRDNEEGLTLFLLTVVRDVCLTRSEESQHVRVE